MVSMPRLTQAMKDELRLLYHGRIPPAYPAYEEAQMSLKQQLLTIFANDAEFISERDAHYKSSWKARGGVGAFFTIARPWDRFAAIAERGGTVVGSQYNIFRIIQDEINSGKTENDDGTLQACIRDLRAYMALLAAEAMTMRQVYKQDNAAAALPSPQRTATTPWRKQLVELKARRDARQGACTVVGVDADLELLMEILFSV